MTIHEFGTDNKRIAHLFKLGIIASLIALIGGDMLFGWGTVDESLTGLQQYFSRYLTVSDARIFWAALIGMIGIPVIFCQESEPSFLITPDYSYHFSDYSSSKSIEKPARSGSLKSTTSAKLLHSRMPSMSLMV